MGVSGLSFSHLLVVLIIVMLLFGTNRLRNLGADLGEAIKGFRNAMGDGEQDKNKAEPPKPIERVVNSDEHPSSKI